MKTLLFLCTGNYYRSRLAEEYFNHLAPLNNLNIKAFSRALSQDLTHNGNVGNISHLVTDILAGINIPCHTQGRQPRSVTQDELSTSDYVYALDKREHQPMVESAFTPFSGKVNYLAVGDVDVEPAYVAVVKLIKQVDQLCNELEG